MLDSKGSESDYSSSNNAPLEHKSSIRLGLEIGGYMRAGLDPSSGSRGLIAESCSTARWTPSSENSSDRRRLPRFIIPGGVRAEDDPLLPPFDIVDISIGGVKFETGRMLPIGSQMMFWFDYYDFVFKIVCEIAWSKRTESGSCEHGARFRQLSRAEQIVIGAYVKDLHIASAPSATNLA